MFSDQLTVEIDPAELVDGAEIQSDYSSVETAVQAEGAVIPEQLFGCKGLSDPGENGFNGKGNQNFTGETLRHLFGIGNRIMPQAVEIDVGIPAQLRSGVLGQYIVFLQRLTVFCQQVIVFPAVLLLLFLQQEIGY